MEVNNSVEVEIINFTKVGPTACEVIYVYHHEAVVEFGK